MGEKESLGLVIVVVAPRDRPCVAQIETVVGPFPDMPACEVWIEAHKKIHPHEEFLITRVRAPGSAMADGPFPASGSPGDVI